MESTTAIKSVIKSGAEFIFKYIEENKQQPEFTFVLNKTCAKERYTHSLYMASMYAYLHREQAKYECMCKDAYYLVRAGCYLIIYLEIDLNQAIEKIGQISDKMAEVIEESYEFGQDSALLFADIHALSTTQDVLGNLQAKQAEYALYRLCYILDKFY